MAASHDQHSDHDPAHDDGHGHDHGHDHGHGHSHAHGGHSHGPVDTGDWRYAVGLLVNLAFVACEVAAGLFSGSSALLADAGHNLSDVLGLAMAGGAAWLVRRSSGQNLTYGYGKATVLAALANALLLIFACGAIAFEVVRRLAEPAPVASGVVMIVAGIGFVINLGTDAGISLGVVVVGALIMVTGWSILDPLISVAIVIVILIGTWGLLKDSVSLAIDAAPAHIDVEAVRAALSALPGVRAVHDLHVWGLSTTEAALTVHVVHDRVDAAALLAEAQALARDKFGIRHTTLQLETGPSPDCPDC